MAVNQFQLKTLLFALVGSLGLVQVAQAQFVGNLTVEIEGLDNQDGNICFKVFSGSQGFPNDNDSAVRRECVAIAQLTTDETSNPIPTYTFPDLPNGTYAIALYHDQNGDELLNRGAFGIPLEGYGFSNNPLAEAAPPDFEEALFLAAGPNTTIQIQLQYFN